MRPEEDGTATAPCATPAAVLGCLAFVALACAGGQPPLPPAPAIDADHYGSDVAWLADDAREGRGVGSAGERAAARYLARGFAAAGLEPAAPDGSYLASFEMPVSIRVALAVLEFGERAPVRGRDFDAYPWSGDGDTTAEVVFVGYGIHDPDGGYDDYRDVDVYGRIALVQDGLPRGTTGPLATRSGPAFLQRADKIANARRHGAVGVLLAATAADPDALPGNPADEGANPTAESAGVPALAVRRNVAARLVAAAGGASLGERLAAIAESGRPASSALPGVTARVAVHVERRRETVSNVVARLPGTDPSLRDEAIVIGAHYDHLGTGAFGSMDPARRGEVHNGADDNASGAAGLLALARSFAAHPARRSLIFAAFTGEEAGLAGSADYVRAPAVPLEATVAMLNLDMIGRLQDRTLTVFGADTSPGFARLVRRAADGLPVQIALRDMGYGPSDHTSFHARGVPVVFFHTGVHTEYHTPDDDAALVDAAGAATVLAVAYRTARAIADADTSPALAKSTTGESGYTGLRPWLGTVPAFAGDGEVGVLLQGVRAGGPAEASGLRAGDRIVAFDGASVANLREFTALLRAASPGQRVRIVFLRDGQKRTTEATLGHRLDDGR